MMLVHDPMPGSPRLALHRPEARNALNTALLEQIAQVLDSLAADPDCHAVLICGHGGNFAAGADIGEIEGKSSAEGAPSRLRRAARSGRLGRSGTQDRQGLPSSRPARPRTHRRPSHRPAHRDHTPPPANSRIPKTDGPQDGQEQRHRRGNGLLKQLELAAEKVQVGMIADWLARRNSAGGGDFTQGLRLLAGPAALPDPDIALLREAAKPA